MKKCFKKALSGILAASMLLTSASFTSVSVAAAGFSEVGGWYEALYAQWPDSNPDSTSVKVGYKLSSESNYTYLSGDDYTYLIRKGTASGTGRVDIPGLKAGKYDIEVTASDGSVYTKNNVYVYPNDRSGYAHFNNNGEGVGAYNDDGTPKDNAIIVYVTDDNKNTVTIPGYGNQTINYVKSTGATWTRDTAGIGDILNNNYTFIKQVTVTDNHPLIFRFIGTVNPPENLTPYNAKDDALGGSPGDNGNLAITKDSRNITLEGVGPDAMIYGWGFTFAKSSTSDASTDKNFEVSNLTFKNYTEDGLAFQGHDSNPIGISRCWVHNNTFYPGYCAKPAESDKAEGDGSCDFKRGDHYTLSYNHFINCHKTNLLGSGGSDDQWYMTLHHNWYEKVGSRQPLAANGNVHIYSTYFDGATSTTVDTRASNATFLEENYYNNCKGYFKSRNNTCVAKSYNETIVGGKIDSVTGKRTIATSREQAAISDNGYKFPNGDSMANFDTNPTHFYYDTANKVSDVQVLTKSADVPTYVPAHAGTLQALNDAPEESGTINVTVKDSSGKAITGAKLTASGLTFIEEGNGVYTAEADLSTTYEITVSKEGYSNVKVTPAQITSDGQVVTATATLEVDTDGYAVVKLQGGTAGTPVIGASIVLNDGTVLVEQGNGIYKSAKQLPVGNYTATITNTGDYIVPTTAQTVVVKTTDAETVITLAKSKGTVNVTLKAADGETETLDSANAVVKVGDTELTYSNGIYTGQVEVGTGYTVTVVKSGWNTDSVSPASVTVTKDGVTAVTATMSYKGSVFVWNYTDGTNTLNAAVAGSPWSSASSNPQTFNGESLTKALKMESSTNIKFNMASKGTVTVVMYSTNSDPSIKIDGTEYSVNSTGATEITVEAGDHTITKGTSSTYIYLVQTEAGSGKSDSTTETTTTTTTTTTKETATTTTTKETTTETTTSAPVEGVVVSVGSVSGNVNSTVVVPVKITGLTKLGSYDIDLTYNTSNLKATAVSAGDMITDSNALISSKIDNGKISVAGSNPNENISGSVLFNVTFTVLKSGSTPITAAVNEMYSSVNAAINASVTAGSVTGNGSEPTPSVVMGDANGDGVVNNDDVKHILNYLTGKIASVVNSVAADVTGDNKITTRDANKIKKFVIGVISSLD